LQAFREEFIFRARFIPGSGISQSNTRRENRPGYQEFQKDMRVTSLLWASVLMSSVAFGAACTKKTEPAAAPKPAEFTDDGGATAPTTEAPVAGLETIYFDYDQSVIRDDQRATLGTNANAIKGMSLAKVTVEGHCDERGSDEYNLALGERRANAVKQYLVDTGVTATIDTVSYGESRAAVQGSDESAWRMNRRAEFVK
jgi:peptidoglycan-associated lipoprotein